MNKWTSLNTDIISCVKCPRLRNYCQEIARSKRKSYLEWDYWGKPVPNFGDPNATLLIVGLAPAAHGGNRTGRMFTGDRSGEWLYRALHKAGFANQPNSDSPSDGLKLINCAITAIAHCAPPDNKPLPDEIENCSTWLSETIAITPAKVTIALGQMAWKALTNFKFFHGAIVKLNNEKYLLASYHPSQQNTFTGKLTETMFDKIFKKACDLL